MGRQKPKIETTDSKTTEKLKDHETAGLLGNFLFAYSNDNRKLPTLQNINTQTIDDIIFTTEFIEQTINKLPTNFLQELIVFQLSYLKLSSKIRCNFVPIIIKSRNHSY